MCIMNGVWIIIICGIFWLLMKFTTFLQCRNHIISWYFMWFCIIDNGTYKVTDNDMDMNILLTVNLLTSVLDRWRIGREYLDCVWGDSWTRSADRHRGWRKQGQHSTGGWGRWRKDLHTEQEHQQTQHHPAGLRRCVLSILHWIEKIVTPNWRYFCVL